MPAQENYTNRKGKALPSSHPGLSIQKDEKTGCVEFRMTSKMHLAPSGWSWPEGLILFVLSWISLYARGYAKFAAGILGLVFIKSKFMTMLWESVIALPGLGLQVEAHLGIPHTRLTPQIPIVATRRFIPMTSIMDIVINEGLRGWNVRYYLAVIHKVTGVRGDEEDVRIEVAFPEILPFFPILKEVYHGLRETLFDEFADPSTTGPTL